MTEHYTQGLKNYIDLSLFSTFKCGDFRKGKKNYLGITGYRLLASGDKLFVLVNFFLVGVFQKELI